MRVPFKEDSVKHDNHHVSHDQVKQQEDAPETRRDAKEACSNNRTSQDQVRQKEDAPEVHRDEKEANQTWCGQQEATNHDTTESDFKCAGLPQIKNVEDFKELHLT